MSSGFMPWTASAILIRVPSWRALLIHGSRTTRLLLDSSESYLMPFRASSYDKGVVVIQVAIVGAGHWGPNLIRNFHNSQISRVAWVIDADPERRARVAASYGSAVQVSGDVRAACSDIGVQAVVVATPTTTHYQVAKMALEHG